MDRWQILLVSNFIAGEFWRLFKKYATIVNMPALKISPLLLSL